MTFLQRCQAGHSQNRARARLERDAVRALFYDLAGSRPVLFFLALGAPKEQGHRAGAGMAADGSTHVIGTPLSRSGLGNVCSTRSATARAFLITGGIRSMHRTFHCNSSRRRQTVPSGQTSLSLITAFFPRILERGDQTALVIHIQQRTDIEHRTEPSGRLRNAPAPFT